MTAALTAELIVDGLAPVDPVISPDGRLVAWITARADTYAQRLSDVWLASVDGSMRPRQLTDGSVAAGQPRWSSDGSWLFYIAADEVRRFRIGADGAVGEAETVLRWGGEIGGVVPLAGGRLVAVIAGDELTKDDDRRRETGDDVMVWSERAVREHWRWHRLRLLDLDSGDLTVAAGPAGRHVVDVAQRPGGGPLAVVSRDCPDDEPGMFTGRLHIVDLDAGTAVDLGLMGLEARSPVWWQGADGWHVAWLAGVLPAYANAVLDVAVPADEGTNPAEGSGLVSPPREPADLTAAMTVCPDELVQGAGGPTLGLFADGLDKTLYRLDPATRAFERVAGYTGAAYGLTASDDGSVIAVVRSTAYAPRDVHAGPPDALVRISDTRPELRDFAWGAQERVSWRASDGLQIEGVLNLPPGRTRADGPFPLVVIIHGGPYGRWPDELMVAWYSWGQWLAQAGFAVLHPNPRGSSGRGRAFADLVAGAVGRGEWTDLLAGIDHLIADGVADPDRLGITGWSHGGFMAAWAVTQTDRFRAALMAAGVVDWAMEVGAGENGRAEGIYGGSFGWEGPGPHPHDQLSPISYAANVRTPILIMNGENDTNVPVGQALYFHRALSELGAEHELVIHPREGHRYVERGHQIDVLERVRSWFTRWLMDQAG